MKVFFTIDFLIGEKDQQKIRLDDGSDKTSKGEQVCVFLYDITAVQP